MTRLDALKALTERVEAGLPNQNDGTLYTLFGDAWVHCWDIIDRGSLDAAKALHEAVLPGWVARHTWGGTVVLDCAHKTIVVRHALELTPARAWLLAILRALIAQEEGK